MKTAAVTMTPWSRKLVLALGLIVLSATQPLSTAGQGTSATNETTADFTIFPTEEEKPEVVLTGIPQKDYIHDPNLPRELQGFGLSHYPFYKRVPNIKFNFSCDGRHDGFYASIPHKCQVYHHCLFGKRFDFLCANYTAFDQATFICQFANRVDCINSELYFDRNNALYKAETTTTTTTTAPARRKKKRPSTTPEYEYYDYYEAESPSRKRTTAQPDQYYDYYYDDEKPAKPITTTTTTTRRPVRKRLPRPRPPIPGPNRRGLNRRPIGTNSDQLPLNSGNRPPRIRQRGQNPKRRGRPNNQGKPLRKRRRRKKTTTTTTAAPEYYDEYEYYDDYYYDEPTPATTTTQSPRSSGRVSADERRRKLLKSRKSKLQQITQNARTAEAATSVAGGTTTVTGELPITEPEVDYQYEDLPVTTSPTRGRGGQRGETSKRNQNRRLRSRRPVE